MKIKNILLAGAMALALIGCGGSPNSQVQTTTQQVCADGQQPLQLANGGLICPNGQTPTTQTIVVQPQQNNDHFLTDMLMFHFLFGSPSYGPGWFGGSQYYNRTTVHNHYYNYGPHDYGEASHGYTSVPPRANTSSNSGLNVYSSKPQSSFGAFSGKSGPSSSFSSITKPSTGSSFNSFSSNSSHSFAPSTKSYGGNSSSSFNAFRNSAPSSSFHSFSNPSRPSFSSGGRSFGRGR